MPPMPGNSGSRSSCACGCTNPRNRSSRRSSSASATIRTPSSRPRSPRSATSRDCGLRIGSRPVVRMKRSKGAKHRARFEIPHCGGHALRACPHRRGLSHGFRHDHPRRNDRDRVRHLRLRYRHPGRQDRGARREPRRRARDRRRDRQARAARRHRQPRASLAAVRARHRDGGRFRERHARGGLRRQHDGAALRHAAEGRVAARGGEAVSRQGRRQLLRRCLVSPDHRGRDRSRARAGTARRWSRTATPRSRCS